ncbi:uncharacterized protein [Apteryx mantelli]|uniref:Uncharacterized protein isoform X2 n=1 Tax=Apteryx mantelli TaxID=2696672 RepID=A0ABM4FGS4_9AVES
MLFTVRSRCLPAIAAPSCEMRAEKTADFSPVDLDTQYRSHLVKSRQRERPANITLCDKSHDVKSSRHPVSTSRAPTGRRRSCIAVAPSARSEIRRALFTRRLRRAVSLQSRRLGLAGIPQWTLWTSAEVLSFWTLCSGGSRLCPGRKGCWSDGVNSAADFKMGTESEPSSSLTALKVRRLQQLPLAQRFPWYTRWLRCCCPDARA